VTGRRDIFPGGFWGWLGGSLLLTTSAYNAVWGAAALAGESYFTPDELLLSGLDEQTWGAITLTWGIALLVSALLVYRRRRLGVTLGVILAAGNVIVQLLSIEAFPGWAVAAILADLLVIYALTHADQAEMRPRGGAV